jgi:AcrR family transcriptional regulator
MTRGVSSGPSDGRRARRAGNQERVLDAVRELFAESNLFPSMDEIADRSGVSVRSIYRYFADTDQLMAAAVERALVLGADSSRIHRFATGDFEDRLQEFVRVRVRLYERHAAGFRAARHHAESAPHLDDALARSRAWLREQTEGQFAPELRSLGRAERRAAAAACDAVSQLDALDYLRRVRGCSPRECEAVLRRAIRASLAPLR